MVPRFPVRSALLGGAMVIAVAAGASAEAWYAVSVDKKGAVLLDTDSRKTAPRVTVNARIIHPGIQEYQKIPIVASQFTFEFDCKANRMRTIEFALIDLDGHVPNGLGSSKVRQWDTVAEKDDGTLFKAFACDGKMPPKAFGPYKRFTDMESRYLMWLGDPDAGDFAHWRIVE